MATGNDQYIIHITCTELLQETYFLVLQFTLMPAVDVGYSYREGLHVLHDLLAEVLQSH